MPPIPPPLPLNDKQKCHEQLPEIKIEGTFVMVCYWASNNPGEIEDTLSINMMQNYILEQTL